MTLSPSPFDSSSPKVLDVDPNFKSTLPPRKRAKTKEEKEQRRVERILRNRRAAHASREKKRKHVEYLESYVVKLEQNLQIMSDNLKKTTDIIGEDKLSSLNLNSLPDLSELKEKIQLNVTSDDDDKSSQKDDESKQSSPQQQQQQPQTPIKQEIDEVMVKSDLLVPNDGYLNYLSPVSINSPINSPIDLTIKTEFEEFESSKLDGFLGQNPEVILLLIKALKMDFFKKIMSMFYHKVDDCSLLVYDNLSMERILVVRTNARWLDSSTNIRGISDDFS